MRKEVLVVITAMVMFAGAVLVAIPTGVQADVGGVDAISEIWGNTFTVYMKWTYTSYDSLEIRLMRDNVLIATAGSYSGFSGEKHGSIDFSPVKAGTYKVQLWSTNSDRELYSKDWHVPELQISLAVNPSSGQIGTTFVATTTFSISPTAPDIYYFTGSLEVNAGQTTFKQNVGGTLYSDHYFSYYGYTDYTIKPVFTATGCTFPTEGNYVIAARYTDSLTNISATSANVAMQDQYVPRLAQLEADLAALTAQYNAEISRLNSEITKTKNDLNSTKSDLADTKASLDATKADLAATKNQLSMTSNNLNDTDKTLSDTKNDLNDKIKSANNMAYAGIAVGVIGILFGLIGIVLARKKKDATQVIAPTPVTYAPAPMQAPPPVQAPPQMIHQQAPMHVPPPQSVSAPMAQPQPAAQAPLGPVNCAKCGAPMPAGMRFCGNCGAAR